METAKIEEKKGISIVLFVVINIVTIILSVTTTAYISNSEQNKAIYNNAKNIGLLAKELKIEKNDIQKINNHLKQIDDDSNPVTIALMQQSLKDLNKAVQDLQANQKEFIKEQQIFYQKIAAKLGITVNY